MRFTSDVNKLQHRGGEDQYVCTKTRVTETSKVVMPDSSSSQVDQSSIARDRARVGVRPPKTTNKCMHIKQQAVIV